VPIRNKKIVHWGFNNGSGLGNVAMDLCKQEVALGLTSVFCPTDKTEAEWEGGMDGDIHVVHSHLPDKARFNKPGSKIVWVGHGTPEVCFNGAIQENGPGAWMLSFYWLQHADARVTFWPRHKYIWESLCDKGQKVHCIPMGVDKEVWKPVPSLGKYAGEPSYFMAENSHEIKWAYDLIVAWPSVFKAMFNARLHLNYLPSNQHHAFYPLLYRNGTHFSSFISGAILDQNMLRNAFISSDFYVNPVRYGDFNRISLEAKASGATVISHRGNPYADYWFTSYDQREMADDLIRIGKGEVEPLQTAEIPDISETAAAMKEIYESIC